MVTGRPQELPHGPLRRPYVEQLNLSQPDCRAARNVPTLRTELAGVKDELQALGSIPGTERTAAG